MNRILWLVFAFAFLVFTAGSQAQTPTTPAVISPSAVWVTLTVPDGDDDSLEGTRAIARLVFDTIRSRPEVRSLMVQDQRLARLYDERNFEVVFVLLQQQYEFLRQPTVRRGALRVRGLHLDLGPDGRTAGLYGPRPTLTIPNASARRNQSTQILAPTTPHLVGVVRGLEQRIATLAANPGTSPAVLETLRSEVAHQAARLRIVEGRPDTLPQLQEVARQLGELALVVGELDGRLTAAERNLGSLTTTVNTFATIATNVVIIGGGVLVLIMALVLLGGFRVSRLGKQQTTLEKSVDALNRRVTHLEGGSSVSTAPVSHLRPAA